MDEHLLMELLLFFFIGVANLVFHYSIIKICERKLKKKDLEIFFLRCRIEELESAKE